MSVNQTVVSLKPQPQSFITSFLSECLNSFIDSFRTFTQKLSFYTSTQNQLCCRSLTTILFFCLKSFVFKSSETVGMNVYGKGVKPISGTFELALKSRFATI